LTIARNLVRGQGVTFDGLGATNGFHPLHLAVVAGVVRACGDGELAVHVVLTLLALAGAATGIVSYRIVRRVAGAPAAVFTVVVWTFNPYGILVGASGVEVALAVLLLALSTLAWLRVRDAASRAQAFGLGALMGLALLARSDGVFLAAAIGVDLWRRAG